MLEERGVEFREHRYLEAPLSRQDLEELARRLGLSPRQFCRTGELAFAESGLDDSSSDDAILDAMARFPILMQRPIVVAAERAVVGRPPERVWEILD